MVFIESACDDRVGADLLILVHVSRIAGERYDSRLAGAVYSTGTGLVCAFGCDMNDGAAAVLSLQDIDYLACRVNYHTHAVPEGHGWWLLRSVKVTPFRPEYGYPGFP